MSLVGWKGFCTVCIERHLKGISQLQPSELVSVHRGRIALMAPRRIESLDDKPDIDSRRIVNLVFVAANIKVQSDE
jgi:hypothetical protein